MLLRKSKTIRTSLGISVPLPADTTQVVQAVFEAIRLREAPRAGLQPAQLNMFPEMGLDQRRIDDLHARWDAAADREKASRALFAQESIKVGEVARELDAVRAAIGGGVDVAAFVAGALRAHGAGVEVRGDLRPSTAANGDLWPSTAVNGDLRLRSHGSDEPTAVGGAQLQVRALNIDLSETPRGLREVLDVPPGAFTVRFEQPVGEKELYLQRTHPFVEALAAYTLDTALDPLGTPVARRAGVIVTGAVERRTTLLLIRYRFHIIIRRGEVEQPLLAEDLGLLAFAGSPRNATWLSTEEAEALLDARPDADRNEDQKRDAVRRILEDFGAVQPHLDAEATRRGEELLDAHRRVRDAARAHGSYRVEPQLPPDVLGLYVYLPV